MAKEKKEILSNDAIQRDLLAKAGLTSGEISLLVLSCFMALMGVLACIALSGTERIGIVVMCVVGMLPSLILFLVSAVKKSKMKSRTRKGSYLVVQDVLVDSREGTVWSLRDQDVAAAKILYFSGHGKFVLDSWIRYYRWSREMNMSAGGVWNTAVLGDTFYLVIPAEDRRGSPMMVYNAKFFEYRDEPSDDPDDPDAPDGSDPDPAPDPRSDD